MPTSERFELTKTERRGVRAVAFLIGTCGFAVLFWNGFSVREMVGGALVGICGSFYEWANE